MSGTNGSNGTTSPQPRAEWIAKRRAEADRTGDPNMSQMHFARKGLLTEEMLFVAEREQVAPRVDSRRGCRGPHDHPGQHQSS